MLSFLSCVGYRYCRFAPFASISFASHHTFRTRNCSKPRFIHECQALFCSSPMIPFEIHIKTSWRHEEDMYNVDHTQKAKSAPNPAQRAHQSNSPARPARPNPTPNPAQRRAKPHAQPSPTRPARPNPTPNPAERAKQSQIRAQPGPARPARPNPRPTQHSTPTSVSSFFFQRTNFCVINVENSVRSARSSRQFFWTLFLDAIARSPKVGCHSGTQP